MTIGYDAKRIVCNGTGLGSYGRTLVNDLAEAAPPGTVLNLYAPERGDERLRRQIMPRQDVRFVYPDKAGGPLRRALWRMHGIVDDLVRDGVKLYHGLSGELPVGIREAGIRTVVTMHDVIFMRHPEWYGWLDRKIYAWKFRKTCLEADRIIAISECTKRDVMLFGGVPAEKIDVIYQSCGTRYKMRESEKKKHEVHTAYMLPERYIVSVGTVEERKNVLYGERVKRYAARNGLGRRVKFLHDVPADDLPAIYQMAEACVYPSRYEGFGLPVIEAIQSGLPVVACTGSCLEEAGGNATLYVDPDDVCAMADAVKKVLKGAPAREERIAAGLDYIRRFENDGVAQRVLEVYDEILNS